MYVHSFYLTPISIAYENVMPQLKRAMNTIGFCKMGLDEDDVDGGKDADCGV